MASTTTHLLYLHGFRSSPQSTKAQRMAEWVAAQRPDIVWRCPQQPMSPRAAMQLIEGLTADWPTDAMAVIGSSLGGFYAGVLAQRRGCAALLLNPAVHPARDLKGQVGATTAWHGGEPLVFEPHYVDELRALEPLRLSRPERCFAVIAKGDEVLDWREMTGAIKGARIKLLEASDHAISDFDDHLPEVLRFLDLAPD